MMKNLLVPFCIILTQCSFSQTWVHNPDWWTLDGELFEIKSDTTNDVVYIGGRFSKVGESVKHYALVNTNGSMNADSDEPNMMVITSVPGPDSSWIFSGNFDKVGECHRAGLAQIDQQGKLTDLFKNTGFNNSIESLQIRDSLLYAAGLFTSVGKFKNFAAFFDLNENQPDYNRPSPNGEVNSIVEIPGGGWYVGGAYSMYGDSTRHSLSKLNADGTIASWKPNVYGGIKCMALVGNILYIGGNFTEVDGQARLNLAAFDLNSGLLLPWNPGADSWVLTMVSYPNRLIIGGYFTEVNGTVRNSIASFNVPAGNLDLWNPNPLNGWIHTLFIDGTKLYAGGHFNQISGQTRNNLAVYDLTTNSLSSWSPDFDNDVKSIEVTSDKIYVGGEFHFVEGQHQFYIAEFYKSNGVMSNWNPQIQEHVNCIKKNNNTLYIGGTFRRIDGLSRKHIASFDMTTGALTNWAPNVDTDILPSAGNSINCISILNDEIFIGGSTQLIGGVDQQFIATINLNNGELVSTPIQSNHIITDILIKDSLLIIAGNFTTINGTARERLAIYDLENDLLTNFNHSIDNQITSLAMNNDSLFIGGHFTIINSLPRTRLAAFNISSNTLLTWSPTSNSQVSSIAVKGNEVFLGGSFSAINSSAISYFAAVSSLDGSLVLNPPINVDGNVNTILLQGDSLLLGGFFSNVNTLNRQGFAAIDLSSDSVLPLDPSPWGYIYSISRLGDKLFLGGDFQFIGSSQRRNLAAMDLNTGDLTSWNPPFNFDNDVLCVENYGDHVFVGGFFGNVNGTSQDFFVDLNRIDGSLYPFDLNANGPIRDMKIKDSLLFIVGSFSSILGAPRKCIAIINLNTMTLMPFSIPLDGNSDVRSFDVIDNRVYFGGTAKLLTETVCKLFVCDFTNGSIISSYSHNGFLEKIECKGDSIYAMGNFSTFNGVNRNKLAAIYNNAMLLPGINTSSIWYPYDIEIIDEQLYIGGWFSGFMQSEQSGIARVGLNPEELIDWEPFYNGDVYSIHHAEDLLLMGGGLNGIGLDLNDDTRLMVMEKCHLPSNISIAATSMNICLGDSTTLSLLTGNLNDATHWVWYKDEVGCMPIGEGTSITVAPTVSSDYYIRGEGACSRKQEGTRISIIVDEDSPVISNCPADQTIFHNLPNCSATASWTAPTALDNCTSVLNVFESHTSGQIFQQGDNLVSYAFTDSSGNSSTCNFTISIVNSLNLTSSISNSTCYGSETGSINITPSGGVGAYSYSWNDNLYTTQDLTGVAAGNYTVTVSDAELCQTQQTFAITEPAPLNTGVTVTGLTMVANTTGLGVSYSWVDCNNSFLQIPGQTSQVYYVTQNGEYAVSITLNGCTNIGTCYIFDEVELLENDDTELVNIYPNPGSGIFYFKAMNELFISHVVDIFGRHVDLSKSIGNMIDLSNEKAGIYIVNLVVNGETHRKKLVKL